MLSSNCAEPVYQFIWEYVTTNEMLPSRQQIADGLALDKEQVSACVYGLRQQGRLRRGSRVALVGLGVAAGFCRRRAGVVVGLSDQGRVSFTPASGMKVCPRGTAAQIGRD